MTELFYRGEPLYMSILSILLFIILAMGIILGFQIFRGKVGNKNRIRKQLAYIKSVGLFTLVFGVFVQLLGLYGAFVAIKSWGSVSPSILTRGLLTSSIPNLYGIIIFLLAYLIWFGLTVKLKSSQIANKPRSNQP